MGMQNKVIRSSLAVTLGLFVQDPTLAQMVMSDAPLFVTDPYPPNVIISPVYRFDFNESAMKDVPWGDTTQATALKKFPWAASPLSVDKFSFRVTPWPKSYRFNYKDADYTTTTPAGASQHDHPNLAYCDQATSSISPQGNTAPLFSIACSETSLYPNSDIQTNHADYYFLSGPDSISVKKSDNKVRAFGRPSYFTQEIYPWDGRNDNAASFYIGTELITYSFKANIFTGISSGEFLETRYHPAKSRYFRSDSNFLYFSRSVAGTEDNPGYSPWPSLGGDGFTAYTSANYKTPYFSPFSAMPGAVDSIGTIDLSVKHDYFHMFSSDTTRTDAYNAKNLGAGAYVGQFWVKTGESVIDKSSYVGYCWEKSSSADLALNTVNFGCSEEMSSHEKQQFATWFTYWRSSGFAARGMMGQLFDRLSQKGYLNKFRFAISYNAGGPDLDTDDVTTPPPDISPNASVKITPFYSIDNANGKAIDEGRTTGEAALLLTLRSIIYNQGGGVGVVGNDSVSFNNAWDHRVSNNAFSSTAAYTDANGFEAGCRRNYEIILTPDYTRLAYTTLTAPQQLADNAENNADASAGVRFPDASATNINMWSDVGAYGYITDMSTLPDNVPSLESDPATHQHVVRYIIGPALPGGKIFSKDDSDATRFTKAANADWPTKPADTKVELDDTYDDLWHMALNSYGKFFPSSSVPDAVDNLFSAFTDILSRTVSGTAVAAGTTSLQNGGTIYQASVETGWRGHLSAFQITKETTEDENGVSTSRLVLDYSSPLWDFAEKISALNFDTERKILTYQNGVGEPFRWGNLSSPSQVIFKTDKPAGVTNANKFGEKVVEYLRGSGKCEDGIVPEGNEATCSDSASGAAFTFRHRSGDRLEYRSYQLSEIDRRDGRNVLGDISNSNPILVSPPTIGYSEVDYPGYNAHRVATAGRPNVLYFGANDGMLHAVAAEDKTVGAVAVTAGQELFAYVPSFVYSNMKNLANKDYLHKYTVDGSPFSADVVLNGVWKTVLAGGVNKGGRGYYLLNISNPTAVVEESESASDAGRLVRWEFTSSDDSDLLYTFNLPATHSNGQSRQLTRLNDNRWAMIVGNGYPGDFNESGTQACLFIIYLTGPTGGGNGWTENTDYRKICVGLTDYSSTSGAFIKGGLNLNGLSTPTPVDLNGDGNSDIVYAGDLNGNMWRFDLNSSNPAHWGVAYSGVPLFVALNASSQRQPIIAPPEVLTHTVGDVTGRMVIFGTGKFMEPADVTSTSTQTVYGVWDRDDSSFTNLARANLVGQVMDAPVTGGTVTYRKQTRPSTPVFCALDTLDSCTEGNKHFGWYWDMPEAGERQTGKANLVGGTIFFNTYYPYTQTVGEVTQLDPCKYGGDGYLMGLNGIYGYMETDFSAFDVNQDGVIDDTDRNASGIKIGAAMGGTTFVRGLGDSKIGIYSPSNTLNSVSKTTSAMGSTKSSGRISWYELLD